APAIDYDYWLQVGKEHKSLKLNRILAGDRDHGARISRVSSAALGKAGKQVCLLHGGKESYGWLASVQDRLWLRLMRIGAFFHLVGLLTRRRFGDRLAFPGWVDSIPKVLARQVTMRVNSRGGAGPHRPPGQAFRTN